MPEQTQDQAPLATTGYDHWLKLNGDNPSILTIKDGGQRITVCGWDGDRARFETGHLVVFEQPSGEASRYLIESTECPMGTRDQYFLHCRYAPPTKRASAAV